MRGKVFPLSIQKSPHPIPGRGAALAGYWGTVEVGYGAREKRRALKTFSL